MCNASWFLLFVCIILLILLIRHRQIFYKQFRKDCHLIDAVEYEDDIEHLRLLIRDGANVNSCDENGETPLMKAVQCDRMDTVKFLISCCANVDVKSKDGKTVFDFCKGNKNDAIMKYLLYERDFMNFPKFLEFNREKLYKMADENTDKKENGVIVIKTNDEWRKEDDKIK